MKLSMLDRSRDEDEGDNDGFSGWGYELTWRVRDVTSDEQPPDWPFTILQRLAKWAADAPLLLEGGTRLVVGAPITGFRTPLGQTPA